MCKKFLKKAAPVVGAVLGSTILPGLGFGIGTLGGSAIGSGVGTLAAGGTPLQALGSGLGSYAGGSLLGSAGAVGPSNTVASGLGSLGLDSVANALPAGLAGSSLGTAVGSTLGSDIGTSLFDEAAKPKTTGASMFTPSRANAMDAPLSLSQFGSLSPEQQSSNIATQGVFGGGEGGGENEYFLNLINRRLVDDSGNVGDMNSLLPIEQSYLSQLGLGGYNNTNDLLEGISKYQYS